VLSPARPRYGQQPIISIRGFRYALPAQAGGEKGRGTSDLAGGDFTRRALAGLRRIRAITDQSVPRPGTHLRAKDAFFLSPGHNERAAVKLLYANEILPVGRCRPL
jgi:hypothetical protein